MYQLQNPIYVEEMATQCRRTVRMSHLIQSTMTQMNHSAENTKNNGCASQTCMKLVHPKVTEL
jgi:hypothetical protein